ncbi:MAG: hypothetical protein OSB21_11180 [Myxococcota bacterium]|nr:hypothetical protein [Myxococcota bacterium]
MGYDLDNPKILKTLGSKIELQEANLRGLNTYARGARYTLLLGLALFTGAVAYFVSGNPTMGAWLTAYGLLGCVTYYLFSPLLNHFAQTSRQELTELQDLKDQAQQRQKANQT